MSVGSIDQLTTEEKQYLLHLARESIKCAANAANLPPVNSDKLSPGLRQERACFVTLSRDGELRGCTGTLLARAPLAVEVVRTAAQTALSDPRFDPITSDEVDGLIIEISVLTAPQPLDVSTPGGLLHLIRPGVDGVTLSRGPQRATFLPQVWQRVPDPTTFLDMLCEKMGLFRRAWLVTPMDVEVYQAEQFSEQTEFIL